MLDGPCVFSYLLIFFHRSSRLRRLQLVCPHNISGEGVIEALRNLPQLEELHLYYTNINVKEIEAIGRSCPLLKSFKLNNRWYRQQHVVCDLEARAIAENMPKLRHLQLFGNKMTNEGLQAIIEGCPDLESLDLRQCFNVHFGGNIGRLCSQRIKDLRRPHDPTDDYRFNAEIYDYETSDDDYIAGMSDIDMVSDYDDYMEFSGGSISSLEYDDAFID